MTYQRFRARKIDWTPATVATVATVQGEIAESVANVASVAEGDAQSAPTRSRAIYEALHPETRHGENQHTRVGQVGQPSFAEATAAATGQSDRAVRRDAERGEKVIDADLAMEAEERAAIFQHDAGLSRAEAERLAFGRPPTPGITIRAPAIELSASEYDAHLTGLIAAASNAAEVTRLAYAQRKGWVVPRGDETVFTRGR